MKNRRQTKKVSTSLALDRDIFYIFIYLLITIIIFAPFIFSDKTLFGTDYISNTYFMKSFYKEYVNNYHAFPLWDPYIHGGLPFVEALHGDTFYPGAWLAFIMPLHRAFPFKLIIHIFLAGVFAYLFFKEKGFKKSASFLAGIVWMLLPIMVSLIYAGHDGKIHNIALLPLMFLLVEKSIKSARLYHYLLLALCYALLVLTAHLQMAYFCSWAFGLYFLFRVIFMAIDKKTVGVVIKHVVLFVLAIALGLMISIIQLLPQYDYVSKYSMRTMHTEETKTGYEYATSWSLHPEEVVSLFINDFVGTSVGEKDSYWGRNAFKLNSDYIGIIILFLALVALIFKPERENWFFLGLALLGLIYSVGATTPLFRLFYWLVPGVKKFRGPSMIIFLTAFSLLYLAMQAIEFILEEGRKKKKFKEGFTKYGLVFLIVLGLITVLMSIGGQGMMSIWKVMFYGNMGTKEAVMKSALPKITANFWIALVLSGLTFFLLNGYLKEAVSSGVVVAVLASLVIVDYWRVDAKFIKPVDINNYYASSPIVDFFKAEQEKEPFRVLLLPNTLPDNYLARFGIEEVSFTAMHGNHLRLYDEFVGRHEQRPNLMDPRFWDLLNIKFVLSTSEYKFPFMQEVARYGQYIIYRNLNYLPRAFPFYKYVVKAHDEVLPTLKDPNFPYRSTLILEQEPGVKSADIADSLITVVPARIYENRLNSFKVDVEMLEDGILFLSENYFPMWHCYENGVEQKILVANYTFRAIPLKKGQHTLEFKYYSPLLAQSFRISVFSLAFTLLLFFALLVVKSHKKPLISQEVPQKKV